MKKILLHIIILTISLLTFSCQKKSNEPTVVVTISGKDTRQTIENFGASDCWTIQNIGLWNESARTYAAKTLFSQEFDSQGNPLGIGLSAWRFNIGAGSATQADQSNIPDKNRRVECFMDENGNYDFSKQAGQIWFLKKAKENGVNQFVAFVNSPPIYMTKNGRANSSIKDEINLDKSKYAAFADFITEVVNGINKNTGVYFNYISPIVEPQWVWMGGQEGIHVKNKDYAEIIRAIDKSIQTKSIQTKILIPEAGSFDYLYNNQQSGCGNQIDEFWGTGENSVGNLASVAPIVTAHGYFMNWPLKLMVEKRDSVLSHLKKYPKLRFWQTEYCIMGSNEGISSVPNDTSINLGLYVARLIHLDITKGNVSAWHWWLAASPYNYNDGLLVANEVKKEIKDTKLTWAFGNFSRFVRPGSIRIETNLNNQPSLLSQTDKLMVSAYKDLKLNKITIVAINMSKKEVPIEFNITDLQVQNLTAYETSSTNNLTKMETFSADEDYIVPPRSVTTFYGDIE